MFQLSRLRGKKGRENAGWRRKILNRHACKSESPSRFAREAVRMADVNLRASQRRPAECRWCLAPEPGVLLHEAVGHGLEGTLTGKEVPIFGSGRREGSLPAVYCGGRWNVIW